MIVGLWVRFTISESPEFQKIEDSKEEVKMPIVDAIRLYPKNILLAMGARFAENGFFYIYATFVLAYATQSLDMNRQDILNGVLIAAVIESVTIPAFGALSGPVGRCPVYIFGAIFSALMSFPMFLPSRPRTPARLDSNRAGSRRRACRHVWPAGEFPLRIVRHQSAL